MRDSIFESLGNLCVFARKSAISHMQRMRIMIIFAAENDLTQMILCLKQTAQTYTEWLHLYCLQLSATPSVLLASRRLRRIRRLTQNGLHCYRLQLSAMPSVFSRMVSEGDSDSQRSA